MKNEEIKKINERYSKRILKYGYNHKALGWTRDNVDLRLNSLINLVPFEVQNLNVLDVGCGTGELKNLFIKNKLDVNYFGIDINCDLINYCNKIHPNSIFKLGTIDSLEESINKYQPDLIFFSGVFNHKRSSSDEINFFETTIKKSFELCKKGVVFNLLSTRVDYKTELNYDPLEVLEFCFSLSESTVINNTSLRYEMSCGVFKGKLNKDLLIFDY
jgi:2-polyprenyl-3-methyl-5-hydroxy-6-metoxy-1,4-benzoquinol methylase